MRNPTMIGAGTPGGDGGIGRSFPTYGLSGTAIDVVEGTPVQFTVLLTGADTLGGGVDWAVAAGTPADFGGSLPSGHATFSPGATTFPVSLPTAGNGVVDGTRPFTVVLSNPDAGGVLAAFHSLAGTVQDDDVGNDWALHPDWTAVAVARVDGAIVTTPAPFFSPSAAWNVPVAALPTATTAANQGLDSPTLVSRLVSANPYFKCTVDTATFPIFVVVSGTPLTTLVITDVPGGSVPQGTQIPWDPAWVPSGGQWLTGGARPGPSSLDAQAVVLLPSTGKEYDLWQVSYDAPTNKLYCTHAHQSTDSYLTGLGVRSGARSVGLLYSAMTLLASELTGSADIQHALAVGIPNEHSSIFYAPANSTDGGTFGTTTGVPAGTRFALVMTDAQIDAFVAAYPSALSAGEKAAGRKLLRCLRAYGFFVTDNAGAAHFWFEDRNSGAATYDAAGLNPVTPSGVPYPNRLLQNLFTTGNLRAIVPSSQYP